MAENEIIAVQDVRNELSSDARSTFCSVQGGDRVTLAKVYNAMNNPKHKVADFINKVIEVKDVFVELIDLPDEETGEVMKAKRVVLIDGKGEAYQAVSEGVFGAIKNAMQVFGQPTWDDPIPFLVRQISVKNGSMLTLEVKLG